MALNPAFFKIVYTDILNSRKTESMVKNTLSAIDALHRSSAPPTSSRPIIDHLREVGEIRSCREIDDHFKRNFDVSYVTTACEYLADRGLIGKASSPVRLTKRSNLDVEELAFFYVG